MELLDSVCCEYRIGTLLNYGPLSVHTPLCVLQFIYVRVCNNLMSITGLLYF